MVHDEPFTFNTRHPRVEEIGVINPYFHAQRSIFIVFYVEAIP